MRRKKHTEKEVHADLVSIVSVRLREGYSIREVNITKGDCAALGAGVCFCKQLPDAGLSGIVVQFCTCQGHSL